MRPFGALLLTLLAAIVADGQSPYPTTTAPSTPWGGFNIAQEVPYQPTLPVSPAPIAPVAPSQGPPCSDSVWQTYPPDASIAPGMAPNGGAIPVVTVPNNVPAFAPQAPIYPPTAIYPSTPLGDAPEPSLRESMTPPDARNGFFQKARFTATWLPSLEDQDLGWTDLRTEVVTALPFFTRENPILITPSYELHFLDGAPQFDLPPRLNDLAIDFHIFRFYDNHWIADFAVTPGLFADDHSFDSSDAFRINGRAVGVYAPTVDLKYVFGVAYVDGGWAKIVPVAGFVYTPNDDVEYEIVFPQPKIAWRLPNSPIPGRDERWLFVKAEYQNASWAFEDSNGSPDVLSARDYRAIIGIERRIVGGFSRRVEVGYSFNRDIKIANVSGNDINMGSTILLRAGLSY